MRNAVIDGNDEPYLLRRKKVKRLTLRVLADQSLLVTSPLRLSIREIEKFLSSSGDFIRRARAKNEALGRSTAPRLFDEGEVISILGSPKAVRLEKSAKRSVSDTGDSLLFSLPDPGDADARKALFAAWEKRVFLPYIEKVSLEIYPRFIPYGVPFPTIRTRRMTSRWGSCIPKKRIVTFNDRLLEAPPDAVEYVVIHEFTHFLVPDHSPVFHRYMDLFCSDWKERKKLLNRSVKI